MAKLGVNIDHVATVRQARGGRDPDPVWAAVEVELGGADGITIHLREDRRHIQDRDLRLLRQTVRVKLNLEMAATEEMIAVACETRPDQVTLVPEKRQELTTEGGLDVVSNSQHITAAVKKLKDTGLTVSLFVNPDPAQIESSRLVGADAVELHTGKYADAAGECHTDREFETLAAAAKLALHSQLALHLGHGLNYQNVARVAAMPGVQELNIGHSIISRAVFTGLRQAVREMKDIIAGGRLLTT